MPPNRLARIDRSEAALLDRVGQRLNLDCTTAAAGVSEIIDENMSNAARVHAVEWGKQLDQRTMIAFGGAAPIHATRLADKCGIQRIIIPTGAGVGSAIGFLQAPISYDVTRSRYLNLAAFDPEAINELFIKMRAEAEATIRLGASEGEIVEQRTAFMRYRGQGHEIDIALPARALTHDDKLLLETLFAERYAELFGRTIPNLGHEVMTWRLSASIPVAQPKPLPMQEESIGTAKSHSTRDIFDPELMQAIPHSIYLRSTLVPGMTVAGPAVIVEDETSTLVGRYFDAQVLASGYLSLEKNR